MNIRKATEKDLLTIEVIYDRARAFMKENGNPNQWDNGYPDETIIRDDIAKGDAYIIESDGETVGVFVFIIGDEPTYQVIEQGQWNAQRPYGTIHRIASAGGAKGLTKNCFDYCLEHIDYLRIDTHEDNISMQRAVERYGFRKCGIIYVSNGPRIAFDYEK